MTRFLQATVEGLTLAAIYSLLALGFVIIYKSTQVLSFAQPALLLFGAYTVSYLAVTQGLPFWAAVIIGVIFSAGLAAIFEWVTIRPMVGKPLFAVAILTIGLDISTRVGVNHAIGVNVRGLGDPWGFNTVRVGDVVIQHRSIAMVVTAVVVGSLLALFFRYNRFGLAMRATAFDQETSLTQGINVGMVFSMAWILGGAMAGLAGMFSGTGLGGLTQANFLVALKALPAIVVGGLDSIPGSVVGALIVGLTEAYTATYQGQYLGFLGSNFSQVMPYVILVIVLLIRPYGLFGTPEVERV